MSGDDHFIKPDNDVEPITLTEQIVQANGDKSFLQLGSEWLGMKSEIVLCHARIRQLEEQLATAKDQRNTYQKRAQEAEKYLKVDRYSFEKIRELLIHDLEEPQRTAFWTAVGARDRIDGILLAGVAEQSGAGAPETSVRCGAPAANKTVS